MRVWVKVRFQTRTAPRKPFVRNVIYRSCGSSTVIARGGQGARPTMRSAAHGHMCSLEEERGDMSKRVMAIAIPLAMAFAIAGALALGVSAAPPVTP